MNYTKVKIKIVTQRKQRRRKNCKVTRKKRVIAKEARLRQSHDDAVIPLKSLSKDLMLGAQTAHLRVFSIHK